MKLHTSLVCGLLFTVNTFAQIGINTTNPSPSSSLDIVSNNSGILIPRMTSTERDAITSPAEGLLIFQTDNDPTFYYYDGAAWVPISKPDNDWTISGDNMFNVNNGSVGVGTTAPNAQLHIAKSTGAPPIILFESDFEAGGLSGFSNSNGDTNWNVSSSNPNGGANAAQAGSIPNSETSTLEYNATLANAGTVSFDWDVSSENNFDELRFFIDGVLQAEISGTSGNTIPSIGYTTASFSLTPGNHLLRWQYQKDSSASSGADTGWVDNVLIQTTAAPNNILRIEDGNEAEGKVLTSDAMGNASWQEIGSERILFIRTLPIPICNGSVVGTTGTNSTTVFVNGVNYTVDWEITGRVDSTNQTQDIPVGGTTYTVLNQSVENERLEVTYTFTPDLPFIPDGYVFSAVNSDANPFNDNFSIITTKSSINTIGVNIVRTDKIGPDTIGGSECWIGSFFFNAIGVKPEN